MLSDDRNSGLNWLCTLLNFSTDSEANVCTARLKLDKPVMDSPKEYI